jgi:hypothetical protein
MIEKQTSDIGKDKSDVAALLSMPINVDRSSEKPPAVILILHPMIAHRLDTPKVSGVVPEIISLSGSNKRSLFPGPLGGQS